MIRVKTWSCRENTSEKNIAYFSISFIHIKDIDKPPAPEVNQDAVFEEESKGLLESLLDDLGATWDSINSTIDDALAIVDYAENAINSATTAINGLVNKSRLPDILSRVLAFKGAVKNLIKAPGNLIKNINGLIRAIGREFKPGNSQRALNSVVMRTQHRINTEQATTARQQKNAVTVMQSAINRTVLATAYVELARLAIQDAKAAIKKNDSVKIESLRDCIGVIDELGQQLLREMIAAGDNEFFKTVSKLRAIRQLFIEQMTALSISLPDSITINTRTVEPALVILYRVTGDSKKIQRFCRRNAINHPSFVVNKSMEVIND